MGFWSSLGDALFGPDPYKVKGPAGTSVGSRRGQMGLANSLKERAAGNAPSAAEIMMKRGLGQAQSQAASTAASQRGVNPALAARMAMRQQAQMAGDVNSQMGAIRAREQALAQQQLAQLLSNVRQQDISEWATQQSINAGQQPGGTGLLGLAAGGAAQGLGMYLGGL